MRFKKRTHTCGELRASAAGKIATLNGWVDSRRDLGGVVFINLRDRYGKTQVVFNPQTDANVHALASELRSEYVISVTGTVTPRPAVSVNAQMPTGDIDVVATELTILNRAETPPFMIQENIDADEELRLRYRYLDLRRPSLQRNLILRHKIYLGTRRYFDSMGFVEVETPVLMKSTPEGARDYLVPSRVHHGKFYALPQSPQTYKQILMVAGMDRYFQIVKCFRDEDLRADRQPEFTQIDVEMSFVDESDVRAMAEGLMRVLFKELKGIDIALPFPAMTYKEAMEAYGSDKPDIRYGLRFGSLHGLVADSAFKIFSETIKNGGTVAGFAAPGCGSFSRSQIDALTERAKTLGAGGLAYIRVTDSGPESPIEKFVGKETLASIAAHLGAKAGDLVLIISDSWLKAYSVLGALRIEIARKMNLVDDSAFAHLWVTDFPMFEFDAEAQRHVAVHHPFTSPKSEDEHLVGTEPLKARARAYDLVLNGYEIAGGSIRIHDRELQRKVFNLLGIDDEQAKKKFGFMLDAFRYGAPPHGGIAFGLDRMCMILSGEKSIRDVIAFPKTTSAMSLMDDSPSEVDEYQLKELHIIVQ
jgi:aspartyl-tRNA synthetase